MKKLTPAMLCELQKILTAGTLDDPTGGGRFRASDEEVHVVDPLGEIIFTPPPAESIEKRIAEICEFANSKTKQFVHPVVKAMALHFAIGFTHPFIDGNGRTARAIFYWYMLKHGYWMFEYLPISRIIIDAPTQYARAYLYTETDKGDLTYFNNYHLKVVVRAINDLHKYLDSQQKQIREAQELLEHYSDLNLRQRMLLQDALMHRNRAYTIKEHRGEYRITNGTARSDLFLLEELGLFVHQKELEKNLSFIQSRICQSESEGLINQARPKRQNVNQRHLKKRRNRRTIRKAYLINWPHSSSIARAAFLSISFRFFGESLTALAFLPIRGAGDG